MRLISEVIGLLQERGVCVLIGTFQLFQ